MPQVFALLWVLACALLPAQGQAQGQTHEKSRAKSQANEHTPPEMSLELRLPTLDASSEVAQADAAFERHDPARSLLLLERRLSDHPHDYEARWRAARASLVL